MRPHDRSGDGLLALLPPLRGRVTANAPLGAQSWFRVGGPAEVLVRPEDADDLAGFMADLSPELPVMTIGASSNLIIRDGGLRGIVVKLARGFSDVVVEPDGIVAGSACLDMTIAEHAAAAGLRGLEFLAGIPGSVGGAVAMNAGAYGSEITDVLDWAEIVTRGGDLLRLPVQQLGFSYRHSALPDGAIVVRARFRAEAADRALVTARIAEIRAARETTQPVRARTGGSTFRNPDPRESDRRAWELIDLAGCRGLVLGGAQVSEKHCNFLLNTGRATAADLEALGEQVRERVQATSGVELAWEIKRIGVPP
ncbi:UDP-N-acetylmuramate dehydrogenase [Lichenicoccus sp.]|uniref:UDP-N-acetylmuramate dehydrogenase n=1 Tax=Lichenicoccus sp. TaxID=2781899 RepID=UPI003D100F8F